MENRGAGWLRSGPHQCVILYGAEVFQYGHLQCHKGWAATDQLCIQVNWALVSTLLSEMFDTQLFILL